MSQPRTVGQETKVLDNIRFLLKRGELAIPSRFTGDGGAGNFLEALMGVEVNNVDMPDAGKFELKFTSGTSLLTLMHLTAQPPGHIPSMIQKFGIENPKGLLSFRCTVKNGSSARGIKVRHVESNTGGRIECYTDDDPGFEMPYWEVNTILNALIQKCRNLILVEGDKRPGFVRFNTAHVYREPLSNLIANAIHNGTICIDFDCRESRKKDGSLGGARDHGTKFRINKGHLGRLYSNKVLINGDPQGSTDAERILRSLYEENPKEIVEIPEPPDEPRLF